ncbi:MAG: glycoside hydrolase family 2 protein [Bacilli bacterium]|nr:glycoside hydrolase family 2 protein [Bacilli bacterium]
MENNKLKTIHLNYDWDYVPNYKKSYINEFPKVECVQLPHTNVVLPYNNFSEKLYQFISSYQKVFTIKKTPKKRYVLRFEGVMAYAEVYLNQKQITSHKGGYTPFMVEVTKELIDGENKLFVMVDSTERKDIPPHGFVVDYLTYGGIYREVSIIEHSLDYIEHALIDYREGSLHVKLLMNYETKNSNVFTFNIIQKGKVVHTFQREYDPKNYHEVNEVVALELWDLDHPVMYTLEIWLNDVIAYDSTFAARKIEMKSSGFYLNGKHLKIRGLNRHQAYPYVGYAMPSNSQKEDADILKYQLGVNTVRSSHYPPSRHFLDRCDEIGLLVFNEIPGWQHIGDKEWQEVAKENVKEMILRDYNHPSVFIWGVRINESPDNDEFYQATSKIAASLDSTRPSGGVRNFKGSHLFEDVYTYNDFVHRGNNIGLEIPIKVTKKEVPYLVTEYNGHMYPTKKFDDEWHRVNHAKRHLGVQNASYQHSNISGAIGWCAFDYNTHKDFGSGDRICYHGVMDMFRIPKYAASVYRSQADDKPFIDVLSNLNIGENEASEIKEVYVLTNADSIKFYINDEFINEFYPTQQYKYLPHAPVIIDDFIGNLIYEKEPFSSKDADRVKDVLRAVTKYGMNLPLKYKIKMGIFLFKNKMSIDEAAKLYEKYIGKWGQESTTYRFEAYKGDELVLVKEKGSSHKFDLAVEVSNTILTETNTYQTTRIVVKHEDEFHSPLTYSNEVIQIKTTGPIELIGPSTLSLIGGSIGFYVKTIQKKGLATITISSNNSDDKIIKIEVK